MDDYLYLIQELKKLYPTMIFTLDSTYLKGIVHNYQGNSSFTLNINNGSLLVHETNYGTEEELNQFQLLLEKYTDLIKIHNLRGI